MAIQRSLGRLQVDLAELERLLRQQGFPWLPIRNAHLLAVAELERGGEPRDPFDRLLGCPSRVGPPLRLSAHRSAAKPRRALRQRPLPRIRAT
jgi:PIN domain nuclease of toxin-antitoxin system